MIYSTDVIPYVNWVSNEFNHSVPNKVENIYWPKIVRLSDRIIYLIGGSNKPYELL